MSDEIIIQNPTPQGGTTSGTANRNGSTGGGAPVARKFTMLLPIILIAALMIFLIPRGCSDKKETSSPDGTYSYTRNIKINDKSVNMGNLPVNAKTDNDYKQKILDAVKPHLFDTVEDITDGAFTLFYEDLVDLVERANNTRFKIEGGSISITQLPGVYHRVSFDTMRDVIIFDSAYTKDLSAFQLTMKDDKKIFNAFTTDIGGELGCKVVLEYNK